MLNRAVNSLLERGLAESPRARELCALLDNRTLAIDVPGWPWELRVHAAGGGLTVDVGTSAGTASENSADAASTQRHETAQAGANPGGEHTDTPAAEASNDARISGGPISLLALMGADAQHVIQRGDVRIDGDIDVAQRFRELAVLLRPDIEPALARVTGAVPAHLLARTARESLAWGRQSALTALTNVAEYLAHERGTLVPRAEADQFLHGVDELREHIDRIDARIRVLESAGERLAGPAGSAQ